MKSSNSNLPLSRAVPAKVHIGSHFDEQQNEIGRTTEAATPRHLPIAYVASASAKLEVYSINSLIQSEARAKEAQRTNPPCCYKGPRFSSIAGRLDIGGHHISHGRRIRQTKGAAIRSMIQKANEDCAHEICVPAAGMPPAEHENAKTPSTETGKNENAKTAKTRKRRKHNPFRSTLNTNVITDVGMCKVCTPAVHSVYFEHKLYHSFGHV